MSSNYVKVSPLIKNKSLVSGTALGGGHRNNKSNLNEVYAFPQSEFTANIGTSNTVYPLLKVVQATSELDFSLNTSNAMVDSSSFNVIKCDLKNTSTTSIKLSMFYSQSNDLKEADVVYTTIVPADTNFYRNYPVLNRYFSLSLTSLADTVEEFHIVNGYVTLSKFTEYNAPVAVGDDVNRFNMANVDRIVNDYKDDVCIDRITDVNKISRLGICDSILNLNQNIWNYNGEFDFDNLVSNNLMIRSSSLTDNQRVLISGLTNTDVFSEEEITLNGTSNVNAIGDFKVISDLRLLNGNNTGEINVYKFGTLNLMAQIKKQAGRMTNLTYLVPPDYKSVIKRLDINGFTGLNLESKLNIYKVNASTSSRELLYNNNQIDSHLGQQVELNIPLDDKDIVYGVINSSNIGLPNFGDSQYSVRMDIMEYKDDNNLI